MRHPNEPVPVPFLPPPDRVRSSRTGWTRRHWEAHADHLLGSVLPWASPGGGLVTLPGRPSWSGLRCDGLEGFARTFLLAAFRLAHGGPETQRFAEQWGRGLAAGADPHHDDAWPRITDCSQQIVEAAAIAVALHESRGTVWDLLPPIHQELVVAWLSDAVGARTWDNNWILFRVVIEEFLASVGAPHDRGAIDEGLDRIEDWYVGDGWYTDGPGENFDYYNAWALHFYPLMWARIARARSAGAGGAQDAAAPPGDIRVEAWRARLGRHVRDVAAMIGTDGAPVYQGRSLCYRMACLAPLWLAELEDCSPLAPGTTRRIASGTARYFAERGSPDAAGLLPLGWHGRFLPSTQPYSGPGSPYWASKGFLGLLIAPEHRVWTDPERPAPLDEADHLVGLGAPGFLLHSTRHDGIVRLLNHGSDHLGAAPTTPTLDAAPVADPHYGRFAFSSRTAPDVGDPQAIDNQLTLVAPDDQWARTDGPGDTPTPTTCATDLGPVDLRGRRTRPTHVRRIRVGAEGAASWQEMPRPDGARTAARVITAAFARGPLELRLHRISGARGLTAVAGGYALAGPERLADGHADETAWVERSDGTSSTIVGIIGWDTAAVRRRVGVNPFGPYSATPHLLAPVHTDSVVLVAGVVLSGDAVSTPAVRESVAASVDGDVATIRFRDDECAVRVSFHSADGPSPEVSFDWSAPPDAPSRVRA